MNPPSTSHSCQRGHHVDWSAPGRGLRASSPLFLLPVVYGVSIGAAQTPALPNAVDRYIRAELVRQRIPGMSVAVLPRRQCATGTGLRLCQRGASRPGNRQHRV